MLRTYAAFFSLLRSVVDTAIIGSIWIAVYYLRFCSHLFRTTKGIPNIKNHLMLMAPVLCICYLACLWSGLYKSNRIQSMFEQFYDLLKACFVKRVAYYSIFLLCERCALLEKTFDPLRSNVACGTVFFTRISNGYSQNLA